MRQFGNALRHRVLRRIATQAPVSAGLLLAVSLMVTACGSAQQESSKSTDAIGSVSELSSVACTDRSVCLVAGADNLSGVILRKVGSSGGWHPVRIPATGPLQALSCLDSGTCYAASGGSNAVVLVTSDGGASWGSVGSLGSTASVTSMACLTFAECLVAGYRPSGRYSSSGVLLRSTDSGHSWTELAPGSLLDEVDDVECGEGTCLASGARAQSGGDSVGAALRSPDRGASWSLAELPPPVDLVTGNLRDIACPTADHCIIAGSGTASSASIESGHLPSSTELILTTGDGGSSWQLARLPTGQQGGALGALGCSGAACLLDVSGAESSGGKLQSPGSQILETEDEGESWTVETTLRSGDFLHQIACLDRLCVGVGTAGSHMGHPLLVTSPDFGRHWLYESTQ